MSTSTIEACRGCSYTDRTQRPPKPFAPQCPVCLCFVAPGDLRDPESGTAIATHYYDPNTGRVEMYPAPPDKEDAP